MAIRRCASATRSRRRQAGWFLTGSNGESRAWTGSSTVRWPGAWHRSCPPTPRIPMRVPHPPGSPHHEARCPEGHRGRLPTPPLAVWPQGKPLADPQSPQLSWRRPWAGGWRPARIRPPRAGARSPCPPAPCRPAPEAVETLRRPARTPHRPLPWLYPPRRPPDLAGRGRRVRSATPGAFHGPCRHPGTAA
ncbi:hypothetical protein D9M70_514560 [compost metagenome]